LEKVVKRAIGYGKPKENEDFTHVILTEKEYNKNERKISDLENDIRKLEREYDSAIERYKRSANDKIAEIRTDADERIAEARAETEEYKNKVDCLENINKNLIRISTERANAKRGLTPKKQHSGYVFLSVEEYIFNCECYLAQKSNKTKVLKLPCFRIRIQSPYDVSFDLDSAKNLIENDFRNKKIYASLGIKMNYDLENWIEQELINLWNNKEEANFKFKNIYKANFQKGFWEVEYLTRYMPVIPQDMILSR